MRRARHIALCLIVGCLLQFGVAYGLWFGYIERGSPTRWTGDPLDGPAPNERRGQREFTTLSPEGSERRAFEVWRLDRPTHFGVSVTGGIAYENADKVDQSRIESEEFGKMFDSLTQTQIITIQWSCPSPASNVKFMRLQAGFPFPTLMRHEIEPDELIEHERRGTLSLAIAYMGYRLHDPAFQRSIQLPAWIWYDRDRAFTMFELPGVNGYKTVAPTLGLPLSASPRFPPMWIGITGALSNTLTYAALLYAGLFGTGVAIRWNRRRRGLCTKCKYQLARLATCPECGTPKRASPSTASSSS